MTSFRNLTFSMNLAALLAVVALPSMSCKAHRSGSANLQSNPIAAEDAKTERILQLIQSITAQANQYVASVGGVPNATASPAAQSSSQATPQGAAPSAPAMSLDGDDKPLDEAELKALVKKLAAEVDALKKANKNQGDRQNKSEVVLDKVQGDVAGLQQAVAENAEVGKKLSDKIAPAQKQLEEVTAMLEKLRIARYERMSHYVQFAANFWAVGAPAGAPSLGQLPVGTEVRVVDVKGTLATFVTKDGRTGEMQSAQLTEIARWDDVKGRRFNNAYGTGYVQFYWDKSSLDVKFHGVNYVYRSSVKAEISSVVWTDDDRQYTVTGAGGYSKVYRIMSKDEICWYGNVGEVLSKREGWCFKP